MNVIRVAPGWIPAISRIVESGTADQIASSTKAPSQISVRLAQQVVHLPVDREPIRGEVGDRGCARHVQSRFGVDARCDRERRLRGRRYGLRPRFTYEAPASAILEGPARDRRGSHFVRECQASRRIERSRYGTSAAPTKRIPKPCPRNVAISHPPPMGCIFRM